MKQFTIEKFVAVVFEFQRCQLGITSSLCQIPSYEDAKVVENMMMCI